MRLADIKLPRRAGGRRGMSRADDCIAAMFGLRRVVDFEIVRCSDLRPKVS
jgi:hypothetical protein